MATTQPVSLAERQDEIAVTRESVLDMVDSCQFKGIVFIERYAPKAITVRHYRTDRMEAVGRLRRFGGPRQQLSQNNGHR